MIRFLFAKLIRKITNPKVLKNSKIDKKAKVSGGGYIYSSSLGKYSYCGENCKIVCAEIGKFCSIGDNVFIGGASHAINFKSTSPVFNEGKNIFKKNFATLKFEPYKKTIIENDVWVGSGAFIKQGVTISNGAVIGMGSVVTKDVPPYAVVGGNPAKIIKYRFDSEVIEKLLLEKWWDLCEEELITASQEFDKMGR